MTTLAPSSDKILPFGKKASKFACRPLGQDRRVTALVGAVRSSKTWTMMAKLLDPEALSYQVAGIRLITGATKDSVYRNVLTDWFEVLTEDEYTYNRQSGELDILGSKWVVMGAKDEGSERNVRGSTVGIWYADEVVLYPENFVQMALNRMSPTGARAYWTTNTDSPVHHVKRMIDHLELRGDIEVINFGLDDNPNVDEGYKAFLRRTFTGMYYQRFILGQWVMAEGAIFGSCWSEQDLCYDGPCPVGQGLGEETVAIDCGVGHPQVYLACFDDGDTVYVDREYVWESAHTNQQKTDGQYADDLEDFMAGGNRAGMPGRALKNALVLIPPECASFDAELALRGIWHMDADNDVADGIRMTSSMMALKKIKFSRERCPKTIAQIPAYAWDDKKAKRGVEEPIKANDDCCLIAGTLITTKRGEIPIESVRTEDVAWTRQGWSPVLASSLTSESAEVYGLSVSDGRSLIGTAGHPVWSETNQEFTTLDAMRYSIILACIPTASNSTVSGSILTKAASTTLRIERTVSGVPNPLSIVKSGKQPMGLFQRAMTCITSAVMGTCSLTSNACQNQSTTNVTENLEVSGQVVLKLLNILRASITWLRNGTGAKKAKRGIASTLLKLGRLASQCVSCVLNVEMSSIHWAVATPTGFAPIIVSRRGGELRVSTTSSALVRYAETSSLAIDTTNPSPVRAHVLGVFALGERKPVYNLTVEAGEYYANGILTHNCDALRYFIKSRIQPWRLMSKAA